MTKIMRNMILLLVGGIYAMINYYVGYKTFSGIEEIFNVDASIHIGVIVTIFTITTILTYFLASRNVGAIIGKVGSYWLGISFLSFFMFLISGFIFTVLKALTTLTMNSYYVSIVNVLIILGLFVYATYHASKVHVNNYDITIDKKSSIDNLKVILISDVHLGYINDNNKFRKAVDKINKQNPDVVVITGDLFDGNFLALQSPNETKDIFNSIKTKYGTYLCWGNHDAGSSFHMMKDFIKETNITLLEDEMINVENKFIIVGRRDSSPIGNQGGSRQVEYKDLELLKEDLPVIVLDHQPSNIEEYAEIADLVLCGHTHKGQAFPFSLITKKLFIVDYGYYRFDSKAQVIVTSGLGTWGPPMRIGSDNEIASINIKFN